MNGKGEEDVEMELHELQNLQTVASEPGDDHFQTFVRSAPDWTQPVELLSLEDALVEVVDETGPKEALKRLSLKVESRMGLRIISHKKSRKLGTVRITGASVGAYTHGAETKLVLNPGMYRRNAGRLRQWIGGPTSLQQDHVQIGPVMFQRLHQNAASVVQGPDGQVYVVAGKSFVAYGQFTVLGVVNQLSLKKKVMDTHSKTTVGFYEEVKTKGGGVVATFVRVPQGSLATVVREQEFCLLGSGTYVLSKRGVKLGTFLTTKESEATLASLKSFTKEQIPLLIDLHLKWSLLKPLKFITSTNFVNPIDLLEELVQSVLLTIVSEERYRANFQQDKGGAAPVSKKDEFANLSFIRRVSSLTHREVERISTKYGILVTSITIRRISFEAGLAEELDALSKDVATQSSRAMLVHQRNETALAEAQAALRVAELQGQAKAALKVAEARALLDSEIEATARRAEADAAQIIVRAKAQADAVALLADAESQVSTPHARAMAHARIEAAKWDSLGDKAVFVFGDKQPVESAFGTGVGVSLAAAQVNK